MKHDFSDMPRDEIDFLIEQYIHKEKYRTVLKYRLLDGFTFERIAELMDMSDRQIKNIVYKSEDKLFNHSR